MSPLKPTMSLILLAWACWISLKCFKWPGPGALASSFRAFRRPVGTRCPCRVYVHKIPAEFNDAMLQARPECATGPFSVEVHFHRWLQGTCAVGNHNETDLFFIPVYSSCAMAFAGPGHDPHRLQRRSIYSAVAWLLSRPDSRDALLQRMGKDHVIVASHDHGRCMSSRPYNHRVSLPTTDLNASASLIQRIVNNFIYVQHNSDRRSPACFIEGWDVVAPPPSDAPLAVPALTKSPTRRHVLAYFRGTIEWTWNGRTDASYSNGLRQRLFDLYGDTDTRNGDVPKEGVQLHIVKGHARDTVEYYKAMGRADLCLCPRGYAPWSPRFVDALRRGCVPVIIADDAARPFENILNYTSFSLTVAEKSARKPGALLAALAKATPRLADMAVAGAKAAGLLSYWDGKECMACRRILVELCARQRLVD